MDKGIFVISLDFELAWGFHYGDKAKGIYRENILGARTVIPRLLELFNRYQIHVTWATVGALACKSKSHLVELIDGDIVYLDRNYSMIQYIRENVGNSEKDDPLHYAGSLIELIRECPNQFIGSHTFSHFFLFERTPDRKDFERDIKAVKTVFPEASTKVFARNQITDEAIALLGHYGFTAFRGVQQNSSLLQIYKETGRKPFYIRVLRLLDTYFPITGHYDYSSEEIKSGELLNIRASSTLRPYNPSLKFLEKFKLKRIKKGLKRAAERGNIYHLYWHPHNFGINQKENLEFLEKILQYYVDLKEKYAMRSMSMEEICINLDRRKFETEVF